MTNKLIVIDDITNEETIVARFKTNTEAMQCGELLQSMVQSHLKLSYWIEFKEKGMTKRLPTGTMHNNVKKIISIQLGIETGWDNNKPVFLEVKNEGDVAQSIAQVTGNAVRMTYCKDGSHDVCQYNGHYFHPKAIQRFETQG
jgi:hypothetical protein